MYLMLFSDLAISSHPQNILPDVYLIQALCLNLALETTRELMSPNFFPTKEGHKFNKKDEEVL